MNTRKKQMMMISLGVLLLIMAVGYAAVYTTLYVTGTASLEATWNVGISSISEGTATGTAYNKSTPTYTGTNATFDVGFKNAGDSMEYEVTITNNGSLDAIVSDVTFHQNGTNSDTKLIFDNFTYLSYGLKAGDIIKQGESKIVTIKMGFAENGQYSTEIKEYNVGLSVTLVQYLDSNANAYSQTYKQNDQVMLDDNNVWRVLNTDGDNITLIRETPLTDETIFDDTYSVSGVETYLNSTYKNSLPENLVSNMIGNVEIPKLGNLSTSFGNTAVSYDISTNNISDFISITEKKCYETKGTHVGLSNCNMSWLLDVSPVLETEPALWYNPYFRMSGIYLLVDGEKSINLIDSETFTETGEQFVFSSPVIESQININEPGSGKYRIVRLGKLNFNDNATNVIDTQSGVTELQEYLSTNVIGNKIKVYPQITINKSAIK